MDETKPISNVGLKQIDETLIGGPKDGDAVFNDFDCSSIPLESEEWPVIIIGSGMTGLITGLLLGYHGINAISFDRHPPSDDHPTYEAHPRATGVNFRSCEILRQLGIEAQCRKECLREFDLDAGLIMVEKMIGGKLIQRVQEHHPERDAEVTPCGWLWLSQIMLEPILRSKKSNFAFAQMYRRNVVHYEEQTNGVLVVVEDMDSKELRKYKTRYLVSCDGNRSPTRQREGIQLRGDGILSSTFNIRFRAEIEELLGSRAKHGVMYITNPGVTGGFRQEQRGKGGLLMVNSVGDKKSFPPGSVTDDEAMQYLQQLTGLTDETPVEIRSIAYWTVASYTAERFASKGGRVMIAGDAAHIMPPTGALGGNTGINDAHNLAWKLAYVINGRAAPSLLETYSVERQPVDAFVVDQATRRFRNRILNQFPRLVEEPYSTVELGCRYMKGCFLPAEGASIEQPFEDPHAPSGTAGSRFPHAFLKDLENGKRISTLDLIKQNFVLIATEDESLWVAAAKELEFKIDTHILNRDSRPYCDFNGEWSTKAKVGVAESLLIRPDGFIAWKGGSLHTGHKEILQSVLQNLLGIPIE